jgi:hypothetical protein
VLHSAHDIGSYPASTSAFVFHPTQREAVKAYAESASRKSDLERSELQKDKTGVFTGMSAKSMT